MVKHTEEIEFIQKVLNFTSGLTWALGHKKIIKKILKIFIFILWIQLQYRDRSIKRYFPIYH